MTDRLTALRELRDKMKARKAPTVDLCVAAIPKWSSLIMASYGGSLDAAKALHEAVLPGWVVDNMGQDVCDDPASPWAVWLVGSDYLVSHLQAEGEDHDPARAWLIAILEALIAQEETPNG